MIRPKILSRPPLPSALVLVAGLVLTPVGPRAGVAQGWDFSVGVATIVEPRSFPASCRRLPVR